MIRKDILRPGTASVTLKPRRSNITYTPHTPVYDAAVDHAVKFYRTPTYVRLDSRVKRLFDEEYKEIVAKVNEADDELKRVLRDIIRTSWGTVSRGLPFPKKNWLDTETVQHDYEVIKENIPRLINVSDLIFAMFTTYCLLGLGKPRYEQLNMANRIRSLYKLAFTHSFGLRKPKV